MPIRDFLQDANGDLAAVNGDFAVVGGATPEANIAAVKQSAGIRLRMFLGEAYLDESKGVDWLGTILVKNPNPNIVVSELSSNLAATPDVNSVLSSKLTPGPNRSASIDYSIGTIYSTTPVNGTVAT